MTATSDRPAGNSPAAVPSSPGAGPALDDARGPALRFGPVNLGLWIPVVLAVLILGLDWAEGPRVQFVGSLTAVPFLAAVFCGWAGTLGAGLTTFALAFGFGLLQDVRPDGGWISHAQLIRLGFILAACVAATLAAAARSRLDARLRSMTALAEVARTVTLRPLEPQLGPVRSAARYPSDPVRRLVGGDVVELLDTPFGIRFILGRAGGNELNAVLCAGSVLAAFRQYASRETGLDDLCMRLDAAARQPGSRWAQPGMALVVGEIRRDGFLHVASCGHAPFLLLPADGSGHRVLSSVSSSGAAEGQPLGRLTVPPDVMSWRMGRGDRLIGCSAGHRRDTGTTAEVAARLGAEQETAAAFAGQDLEAGLDELFTVVPGLAERQSVVLALEFAAEIPLTLRTPRGI